MKSRCRGTEYRVADHWGFGLLLGLALLSHPAQEDGQMPGLMEELPLPLTACPSPWRSERSYFSHFEVLAPILGAVSVSLREALETDPFFWATGVRMT